MALAAWVALLGPTVRAWSLPAGRPAEVAFVAGVGLALALLVPPRLWFVRLLVAGAAGAGLVHSQGEVISVWVAAGIALAPWVTFGRPPLPRLRAEVGAAVAPVVVLCGVAAWLGREDTTTWQMLVPLALACVMPLLVGLHGGAMDRVAKRVGEAVGESVSTLSFSLVSTLVVGAGWVVQRTLGFDPLAVRPGWSARDRVPTQASQPWAPDPSTLPAPPSRRKRATLGLAALAATVALAANVTDGFRFGPERADPDASAQALRAVDPADGGSGGQRSDAPAAHRSDPWYPAYVEDIDWVLNEKVALRPLEIYRLLDVETRTVNVHDRYRDTWTPPPCECQPVRVWLYGGSGAFGLEQRDDHTIASALSALALREGITLEVSNRGMPGQAHWRNALRFAWDLTTDDPPDLVVFYEGAEEIDAAVSLDHRGAADVIAPYEAFAEDLFDDMNAAGGSAPEDKRAVPEAPDTVAYLGWPQTDGSWSSPSTRSTPEAIGRLAVTRYERSLALSDDTAEGAGLPVRYFWQPSRYTRTGAEADSAGDPGEDRARREQFAAASDALGDQVVDLTGVFAGIGDPLFVDGVHHNERGARVVAAAILDELRPDLRRLRTETDGDS
ncbi:MAG: hypothetical protein JWM47_983 [Acidimicrobiales bacterium]|nr:hypothetical protein [Acidimicrobiales bacterium]